MKVVMTDLIPRNSRKSFYGKAKVMASADGWIFLKSYDTLMCGVRSGEVRRYSDHRSATTDRHVKAFLETFAEDVSPKEFRSLAVSERPELLVVA